METSAFDFALPDDLIAQQPIAPRDAARLLVVRRNRGRIEHHRFHELPELLSSKSVLVRNDTRVVPARLLGRRVATGGKWEGLFLRELAELATNETLWEILATTRGKPAIGEAVMVADALRLTLRERRDGGRWIVRPESAESTWDLLQNHGKVPLPPYIRKGTEGVGDRPRYQTIYARAAGAVAAPTAGLHFTDELFQRLASQGVETADVTLHVGLGTFRPIEVDRIEDHVLHAEWGELSPATATILNVARAQGRKIVAVGTTSTRLLETAAASGEIQAFSGDTALYLRPGHQFRAVDALITNFHLPRSSLLVLVSAFAGYELMREAYAEAVRERYRFYSYGDAMLVL